MDAADEADLARGQGRLVVADEPTGARQRYSHVGSPRAGARPRIDAENRPVRSTTATAIALSLRAVAATVMIAITSSPVSVCAVPPGPVWVRTPGCQRSSKVSVRQGTADRTARRGCPVSIRIRPDMTRARSTAITETSPVVSRSVRATIQEIRQRCVRERYQGRRGQPTVADLLQRMKPAPRYRTVARRGTLENGLFSQSERPQPSTSRA